MKNEKQSGKQGLRKGEIRIESITEELTSRELKVTRGVRVKGSELTIKIKIKRLKWPRGFAGMNRIKWR